MIIASVAALASTTFAAPRFTARQAPLEATFLITNDQSGYNADFNIIVGAAPVTIAQALGVTGFPIWATSLDFVNPGVGGNNVQCEFNAYAEADIVFSAENTHLDLDGNPNKASKSFFYPKSTLPFQHALTLSLVPVDVSNVPIKCNLL
jgi:hypothetical protein